MNNKNDWSNFNKRRGDNSPRLLLFILFSYFFNIFFAIAKLW